jgi:hypothetical protein
LPIVPQGTQLPLEQVTPAPQTLQLPPVVPQAEFAFPVSQPLSSQQPEAQELAVHTQLPLEQARLAPQGLPLVQQTCPKPPQVSHLPSEHACVPLHAEQLPPGAPQAAELFPDSQPFASQQPAVQEAEVQPQVPAAQARPGLQAEPPQQACFSAPQAPHAPALQFCPGLQALQLPAAGPQAVTEVPGWQTPAASQQPAAQEAAVQAHLPPPQARPVLQLDDPQQS